MKKRIFIGSSSEEKDLARAAQEILEPDFDVSIWDEKIWDKRVFKLNENFLYNLLEASLKFDFGILIGTKDDRIKFRGKKIWSPRDNIIFELGLFLGRLGPSRCAFIVDESIKQMSDLNGISLTKFNRKKIETFKQRVQEVKEFFNNAPDTEINFFPSSTLANVYYDNFILPTCKHIIGGIVHEGKKYDNVLVNVTIPESIFDNPNLQFDALKNKYKTKLYAFEYEGRPRKFYVNMEIRDEKLEIIDFPTLLSGLNFAILQLLPKEYNNNSQEYKLILSRELERFKKTLEMLLSKGGFNDFVVLKNESE